MTEKYDADILARIKQAQEVLGPRWEISTAEFSLGALCYARRLWPKVDYLETSLRVADILKDRHDVIVGFYSYDSTYSSREPDQALAIYDFEPMDDTKAKLLQEIEAKISSSEQRPRPV